MKRVFSTLLVLLLLSACQSIGLSPATTVDNKISYSYGIYTAVLQTVNAMELSNTLSKPDGFKLLALADQARALLDAARAVEATDVATASNKLALATSILTQLQTYLKIQGVK